jgi:uncharacterized membrane protein YgcG
VVLVVNEKNEMVMMRSAGEVGRGRKQLSEEQLAKAVPNAFVFTELVHRRKVYMVASGKLAGAELQGYETVFEPRLMRLARQFLGDDAQLSAEYGQRSWGVFVCFERDVMYEIYAGRLSFADLSFHLTGSLLAAALAKQAVIAAKAAASGAAASSAGGGAGAAAGAGGSRGGGGGGGGGGGAPLASYLMSEVPAQHREACCIPFWRYGRCTRRECTHAATGHKCMRCGSLSHGGAQCPKA